MKSDAEVRLYMKERSKGRTQEQAAAKAGMSVRAARRYGQLRQFPSQLKQPRAHRTARRSGPPRSASPSP